MMKSSVHAMTRTALMTAMMCVMAQLSFSIGPVPVTMQMFSVALAGYMLGMHWGPVALILYLLLGACGLPVFHGFTGGANCLIGPTGGFLWAFPFMALLCGLAKKGTFWERMLAGIGGILVVYIIGVVQLSIVAQMSLAQAAMVGAVPFFIKDVVSTAAAALLESVISTRLSNTN